MESNNSALSDLDEEARRFIEMDGGGSSTNAYMLVYEK